MFVSTIIFLLITSSCKGNEDELERRLQKSKLNLWARGDTRGYTSYHNNENNLEDIVFQLEREVAWSPFKLGPIRELRREIVDNYACIEFECMSSSTNLLKIRGGGAGADIAGGNIPNNKVGTYGDRLEAKLAQLAKKFGPDFTAAIEQNKKEHTEDCEVSCQSFYCASSTTNETTWEPNGTVFRDYSFGGTPPEDFAEEFNFPLDLIKVSEEKPTFPAEEAQNVVKIAEEEGVDKNEYKSGKYKLGGDWLINLPRTRAWFNQRLETTFFPLLAELFPEIVSSTSVLRAHSVSLLKYNSSHPRTDVHIDNGILAMTVAMTKLDEYEGGGTFFEHMSKTIPMDIGHITVRPGSVRHSGDKVTKGTRYILGAFLLIKDRVEHVRRLKNKGSELRRKQNLKDAAKHFEWALAINPKCTTCLKDWAEILMAEKKITEAEEKIREALRLLENKDSDALFSLGVILSGAGRDDESIEAYAKSVELNADDAELCYNLGIKLGERGEKKSEMAMYARAISADPTFGGAWLNWGTTLVLLFFILFYFQAETMFLKALNCPEVKAKAMMNLALVFQKKGEGSAAKGDFPTAKQLVAKAAEYLEDAKKMLDEAITSGVGSEEEKMYASQFGPLRLHCHRLAGSILFGQRDFAACEEEFREATKKFPYIVGAWEMLARVLELQGKSDDLSSVRKKIDELR